MFISSNLYFFFFFFNDTATTEIYTVSDTLSLHDALPISKRFASTRLDKFDGVPHHVGELGVPLIDGALAQLECVTVSTHVEGDHTIFVGRVERVQVGSGEPLIYYRGRYDRLSGASS